jgi:hypothetical protein
VSWIREDQNKSMKVIFLINEYLNQLSRGSLNLKF